MLLATHTEIQEKVFEELKEVFYSEDVEINYDNLNKLDLLERVIKESLRLCPVVPGEMIASSKSRKRSLWIYCVF
jgi:cytochrome P450